MHPAFPHQSLFQWYKKFHRDLPWRKNPSPYKIWVSEIMLQQTQVKNVVSYYQRFLKRFPDLKSLSKSSESEILQYWSGLGYYQRARNMLKTAKIVMQEHGGNFPEKREELLKLPGIGHYTAGAILSIAYNRPEPILDGNVRRVLSRFFLLKTDQDCWKSSGQILLEAAAQKINPSEFNQSLMEIGALVCLPKNPSCGRCPLETKCKARQKNLQSLFPETTRKPQPVKRFFALLVLYRTDKNGELEFLIRKRSRRQRWLKLMWEFPMIPIYRKPSSEKKTEFLNFLKKKFQKKLNQKIHEMQITGSLNHSITHHRLKIEVITGKSDKFQKNSKKNLRWIKKTELKNISSSSMLQKTLKIFLDSPY